MSSIPPCYFSGSVSKISEAIQELFHRQLLGSVIRMVMALCCDTRGL